MLSAPQQLLLRYFGGLPPLAVAIFVFEHGLPFSVLSLRTINLLYLLIEHLSYLMHGFFATQNRIHYIYKKR